MGKRRSRRQLDVDDFLPDGEYYLVIAYVSKGSDFTPAEAVTRLQAALKGRVVRAFPCRRDRRVLGPWGGDLIVGFYLQAAPSDAGEPPAAAEVGGLPTRAGSGADV